MALPKRNRLSKKKDIEKVLQKGKRITTSLFHLFFYPNNFLYPRFAFTASKKVSKKAVVRNRLRRQASSWVYRERAGSPKSDYVLLFLSHAAKASKNNFYDELKRAFQKI